MSAFAYNARQCASMLCAAAAVAVAIPRAPAAQAVASQAVVERVRADLAARRSVAPSAVRTISVDAAIWRDTSLGCGKPNESYAQIDVEGWRIVLEYNEERFDYRARKDGRFILCTRSLNSPR